MSRGYAAIALAALLAACATNTPPPPAPHASAAAWQFSETADRCTARAELTASDDDDPLAMTLTAERGGGMIFAFSHVAHPLVPRPPGFPATLKFIGAGTSFTIPAAIAAPHVVDTELPLNDSTLAQAEALLGGGTLIATGHNRDLPPLTTAAAGEQGAAFLACARRFAIVSP
jgi:hypothetical protein